jgi:translation initiation factor 2 alpha subunit (eIF-2alpha)
MDSEKGFIDVEKRSIDEKEQITFEQLILFYEKVFNTFVKAYYIYNPDCSLEDVYNFLRKTLWLQDPKLIQKNLVNIHIQPDEIIKLYNIDHIPENDIFNQLSKHIKKPSYKHIIKLEVKTISLEGVKNISNTLEDLSKKLDIPEFLVYGVPYYYCRITTEYNPEFKPQVYLDSLKLGIEDFINQNKNSSIGIKIEELYYKLN